MIAGGRKWGFRKLHGLIVVVLWSGTVFGGVTGGGGGAAGLSGLRNYGFVSSSAKAVIAEAVEVFMFPGEIEVLFAPGPWDDADANGLADGWERIHFGETEMDPEADPDSDGMVNEWEMLAGTDPFNPRSRTRTAIIEDEGELFLPLKTRAGLRYMIWVSADLENWRVFEEFIGSGSFVEWNVPAPTVLDEIKFFRIEISLP